MGKAMEKIRSKKRRQFCIEYISNPDLNQTVAYMNSGYKCSKESARRLSNNLLTNVDIQAAIAELMEEREKRTQITQDIVLKEESLIAFADPVLCFTDDGVFIDNFSKMPEEIRKAVSSVDVVTTVPREGNWKKIATTIPLDNQRPGVGISERSCRYFLTANTFNLL